MSKGKAKDPDSPSAVAALPPILNLGAAMERDEQLDHVNAGQDSEQPRSKGKGKAERDSAEDEEAPLMIPPGLVEVNRIHCQESVIAKVANGVFSFFCAVSNSLLLFELELSLLLSTSLSLSHKLS
jgi:hypothetical protein